MSTRTKPNRWTPAAAILALAAATAAAAAAPPAHDVEAFFESRVAELAGRTARAIAAVDSPEAWQEVQAERRRELREMLGIEPPPQRGDLATTVTGTVQGDGFTVRNLHFQSTPGLYVTANLYVPDAPGGGTDGGPRFPAILYLCGHAGAKEGDVSLGNKTKYHHHGAWFARNGYVCLTLDSLQLGEIEGIHHGTYRYDRWWWNSRGYTPAGVEAWNSIRALDVLESLPEVDPDRIGATGRSGGGIGSWWVAALDDRIKVAVPVAGLTTLRNHVVDGCVEGHCDCMYPVNSYGWDHAWIAALVAPRALLVANSDKDTIFPLDGVVDIYNQVRGLYRALGAEDKLGLHVTEGPHKDTQPLRAGAFEWINRHLKGSERTDVFDDVARPVFELAQLRVLESIPGDERNTSIDASFVPMASAPAIESGSDWQNYLDRTLPSVRDNCLGGWPGLPVALDIELVERGADGGDTYAFTSEPHVRLALTADFSDKNRVTLALGPEGFEPRSVAAPDRDDKAVTHLRRRYMLLGTTLDTMRAYDIARAVDAARQLAPGAEITLRASGDLAALALYATLFGDAADTLELESLPAGHATGPDVLNALRVWDLPQALAAAATRSKVVLSGSPDGGWDDTLRLLESAGLGGRLELR